MRRKKAIIPPLLSAGLTLALVSFALSGGSEGSATSSLGVTSDGKPAPKPPGCPPEPPWAKGLLLDLYRLIHPCDRCDDGNPCTKDSVSRGKCVHKPLDGKSCDDGNKCTLADACSAGVCEGDLRECSNSKVCTSASCNPKNGRCETRPATGTSCNDGNPCTGTDTCVQGACRGGSAPDCSTENPCLVGSCSAATGGCAFEPVADGTTCNDGNVCDGSGVCRTGRCEPVSTTTLAVSGRAPLPLLVAAAGGGRSYVVANVTAQNNSAVGITVNTVDTEGDILVTELDREGRPVFATLIAGPGTQNAIGVNVDEKNGDLQVFLETNRVLAVELETQRCSLDGDFLFCAACTIETPDGPLPCGPCGNGRVDHPAEECDDGNDINSDECNNNCSRVCFCNGVPCDCDTGGIILGPGTDPDPGPLDPTPGAPIGQLSPVAPSPPSQFSRALAPISAAAVIGSPVCVVPGEPDRPGNAAVTVKSTGASLVLVYPDLGVNGAWRPVTQSNLTDAQYLYGYTTIDTDFGGLPASGNPDIVAGIYPLAGLTGCVDLTDVTPSAMDQFGSTGNELASRGQVSASKLWLFSSFTSTSFDLGGSTITCAAGGSTVAAVAPGTPTDPAEPAPLVVGTPAPVVTCLAAPPPPSPPPAAAHALPSSLSTEATAELPVALLGAPEGSSNPFDTAVSTANSHGIWWAGAMNSDITLKTPQGDVEVPAEGEGLDAFVVLVDDETGAAAARFTSAAPGDDVVRAIASDRNENILIAGNFDSRIDIGTERFFSRGGRDLFVARLSPAGDILFRTTFGGPGDDSVENLSVSPDEDALQLTFTTEGDIDVGTGPLAKGSHFVRISSASNQPSCVSDNPCQVGSCDAIKGCVFAPLPDGSECASAGAVGKCLAGNCSAGN